MQCRFISSKYALLSANYFHVGNRTVLYFYFTDPHLEETVYISTLDQPAIMVGSGYCCERNDRAGRVGGGVACYVAATVPYDRLLDIEDNEHEVMWIRLRLHKLPRRFASIVIACIYHPPNSDNSSMREYIIATLDGILRRHPDCGIILIGDFNQLRDMFLRTQYGFAQLVNTARNSAILDKLWTNMEPVYDTPAVLDTLGTSDHRMVLLKTFVRCHTGHWEYPACRCETFYCKRKSSFRISTFGC